MRGFLVRLVINMAAIALTAELLPGIAINGGFGTLLLVALVFGIVNAIVKPILILLTCPAVILSLGLFILVINGLMLLLTSSLLGERFIVDGFGTAFIGGIVMGIIAIVIEAGLRALGFEDDDEMEAKRKRA
jgi:putative membrane protein